jgi:MFS family permease
MKNENQITPLPKLKVFLIFLIRLCDTYKIFIICRYAFSSIFPYIAFMIEDFRLTRNPSGIGFYAGFLSSSFFFAQFLTSPIYGYLSDKVKILFY